MEVGYQVGQVVSERDCGPATAVAGPPGAVSRRPRRRLRYLLLGHHYLIDPFQHFPALSSAGPPGSGSRKHETATSVLLLPLLNPVDVAEQVATLDHICEGRLILGLGLGYRPEECEAFGTRMSERGGRASEALELMLRLWTEEEVTITAVIST